MYEQQPFGPAWPPAPVPPPGAYQQPSAIAITTRYFPLAFLFALFKPEINISGQPVPGGWGRTVTSVSPGQHHVHVHVPYFLPSRVGIADLAVMVQPGQTVELEYRAPLTAFSGGSLGSPPQRYRGVGVTVGLFGVAMALSLVACLLGVFAIKDAGKDVVTSPTLGTPSLVGTPPPTGEPTAPPTSGGVSPESGKPTLKPLPSRALIGPVFGAADDTYTMAFKDWPFAFRTPGSWGCVGGKVDTLPDAKAWTCIDEKNPTNKQRLNIILRSCPGPCGKTEQDRMTTEWFDKGATATSGLDDTTFYVETTDDEGRYVLDVSHFFGATAGAIPTWQVGISAMAPPADKAVAQKVANDILSQTP